MILSRSVSGPKWGKSKPYSVDMIQVPPRRRAAALLPKAAKRRETIAQRVSAGSMYSVMRSPEKAAEHRYAPPPGLKVQQTPKPARTRWAIVSRRLAALTLTPGLPA